MFQFIAADSENFEAVKAIYKEQTQVDLPTSQWLDMVTNDTKANAVVAIFGLEPVAVVQLDQETPNRYSISVVIAPSRRGTGQFSPLMKDFIAHEGLKNCIIEAYIATENKVSKSAFQEAGFSFDRQDKDGNEVYLLILE